MTLTEATSSILTRRRPGTLSLSCPLRNGCDKPLLLFVLAQLRDHHPHLEVVQPAVAYPVLELGQFPGGHRPIPVRAELPDPLLQLQGRDHPPGLQVG